MPIYEYHCRACGHRTEILHGINEPGPQFCPACGAEGKLRKTITAPSIVFKGSGWAKKDRRPAPASSKKSSGSDGEAASTPARSGSSASGDAGASSDGKSSTTSGSDSAKSSQSTDSGGD